jgi:pimeloyl-ACP methyl ester carboxylesterase
MPTSHQLTIDGVSCAFHIIGDPSLKQPIFYHHGFPSSGREALFVEEFANQKGLSLIAIDRPGMGESEFIPTASFRSYANAVSVIGEHLGLSSYSHLAVSGGVPFALHAAAATKTKSIQLCLVSGMGPYEVGSPAFSSMVGRNRTLLRIAQNYPLIGYGIGMLVASGWRTLPGLSLKWLSAGLTEADQALLSTPNIQKETLANARSGCGGWGRPAAQELITLAQRWDPSVLSIPSTTPILLFHGDRDRYVPVAVAEQTARLLGDRASLTVFPREGHFLVLRRYPEILDAMTSQLRTLTAECTKPLDAL